MLSTKTTSLGAGSQVFPSFTSKTISSGTTGYIFITVDLPFTATAANTISVNAITTADISFVSGNKTGTANASGTKTIIECTPTNVTGLAATVGNASLTVSWTNPSCFDEVMIVAKPTSSVAASPSGNGSAYTANLAFGTGGASAFDGTGFVVYKGSTSPQTITGLTNGTTYFIDVFTRKGTTWSSGSEVSAMPFDAYVWVGANNGSWSTAGNWNPSRTSPQTSDILRFNSNSTLTITGVSTQTIGKLEILGTSTKITLQASAASQILTIGNQTGTDLLVDAGCELNISGSNSLSIVTAAGATGSISGGMKFTQAAHTLIPNDANAVTFNNGSSFAAGDPTTTGFTGNVFGPNSGTTYNGVVFSSGSTFTQNEGSNPFAITQPNSRVQFQSGSNFIFALSTGSPSLSGRSYGNLEISSTSTGLAGLTGSSALAINGNLTITAAGSAVNLNLTGGISISGNISIASGLTLGFSPASSNTLTLNGTSQQTISGSGTLTIGSNASITINNNNGVVLNRNLTLPSTLTLTAGTLSVGANTLTLNGSISRTSGNIDASNASATVVFSGSTAQSIPASTFTGNINNFTLNNSAGLNTSQNLAFAGTLTLTAGTLSVGANTLTLNGSISRTSGNIDASNASATVVFSGSSAQSIPASTFTGNINNFTLNNSAGLSTAQNLTFAGTLTLTAGTLSVGANTLTLNGSISRTSGNVDASNASATVVFNGSSAQSIPDGTFTGNVNNLTLNNSAGLSTSQSLTVANTLTLTSGNLSLGNSTLTLNGAYPSANVNNITTTSSSSLVLNCTGTGPFTLPNFTALNALTINSSGQSYALNSSPTLSGNLTLTSGTLTVGANTLTLNGSISRTSGNVDASNAAASVVFGGSSAQTIADGSFTGNVNNLTVNNSSGVTCNQALTVVGILNLQSGALNNSTNTLTVSGSVSRTSGFVNGNLLKTVANGNNLFEVGGSVYAPVTLNFTGISGSVQITARAIEGTPTSGSNISPGCNHYWTLSKTGAGTFTRYNATFNLANTTNGGALGSYKARFYNGSSWTNFDFSISGNTITTIYNTSFGEFAFGELTTGYVAINVVGGSDPLVYNFGNLISGNTSNIESFQVSGAGLNTSLNMVITAPTNYEVSTDGISFNQSLTFLNPDDLDLPIDIYLRYAPSSASGTNNAVLTITSDGAATKNIELSGNSIATEPTTAPTLTFGTRTATSVVLNFTGGNGSKRLIIARETSATSFTPTDATNYTTLANSDFSAAADQGSGNKIVFAGSGSSVTVTGLTTNSTYHFTVFEYNEGTLNSQNYFGTGNTGSITLSSALFASGTGATDLTQDFSGLANTGTSSTLPSGWYVSESGFNANSTYTANNGSNNLGDIYSFGSTSAADRAIGTLRDDNLAPTIGTQLVNNTGETITSIAIQYTGEQWRLGATGRADRLDFQYSTDATSLTTGTWTDVNSLDFSSPITTGTVGELDGNASNNRTIIRGNITGVNLTANATLWIRWADADIAGAEDGLAIDDVIITPFSNTRLTGNTDVNAGSYTNLNIVNDATLQGNATITGQIRFQAGTKINLNGNTLTLSGVISGSPTFVGGTTSALIINGSGNAENINFDQTTSGTTNRLQNLTLNRASTTITLGNELQITGTVTPDAGTINANGNLVLVSTSETQTGRIAQIQSGADVIGNVTVQRFMQGGVIARRGWRTMSSPTAGFTFNDLKDDIFITGPGGATNGFDNSTPNSSILTYQENTTGGRGWKNITNTSNSLSEGHGMLVFFRGDRGQTSSLTNTSTVPNNTVMDYVGNINKGFIGPVNLSYTSTGVAANDGWNLLGNPYPCEINYGNIGKVGNVSSGYWVWNTATGNYESKLATDNIAIGQGFFVQTTSGGSALSFAEDDKTNTTPTAYFKTQVIPFAVKMYQDSTRYDIAWLHNEIGAVKNYVFNEDAMKLLNSNINMGFVTTDNQLVQRNVVGQFGVNTSDTLVIRTNAATNGTYTLKFEEINQIPANKQVYLLDLFNNNLSNIRNNAYYSFTINNSNNATRGDRFRLIITDLQNPLPVKLVEFKGKRHNQNDKLVWTTAEEKNMLGYEIQQSTDGEHFEAIGLVKATNQSGIQTYTFANTNVNGKVYYRLNLLEFNKNETSWVVVLDDEALTTELSIYPNPANNVVNINIPSEKAIAELKIIDAAGRVLFEQKQVEHSIGVDVSTWPKGVYFIQATELPTRKLVVHHE
ncbi:MAG: T9SS type A sorting domain-containing protein [Bacteroidota bacterium]